jgi:SAM-dependent methyltransferase
LENATIPMDNDADASATPGDYASEMLQLYCRNLNHRREAQLLDMGPVCEENIMFFAHRVKRHYVCDMFNRLNRHRRSKSAIQKFWNHLDYPPKGFDGIHLYDLADHLDDNEVGKLLDLCHQMLKPEGSLLVSTFEAPAVPSFVCSFVIRDIHRLTFRPQLHLDLPLYFRSNRELTSLLARFRLAKSFLYRNGVREFLFQRV